MIQPFLNSSAVFTELELFSHGLKSMKVNIIKPLWSVRNRFPPPTSLKQHEDVLPEEWHNIPLKTVQNFH
jgi:hypothetical protein